MLFSYKLFIIIFFIILFIYLFNLSNQDTNLNNYNPNYLVLDENNINKYTNDNNLFISDPNYSIKEFPNFLSYEVCDRIIKLSKDIIEESQVYSGDINKYDDKHRSSYHGWLDDSNVYIYNISKDVAKLTNTDIDKQEALQVVKYNSGGFFNNHYDPCVGNKEYCKRMTEQYDGNDRLYTFIIYLNDDYTGGETIFPIINKVIKPEKGKAVLFQNIDHNGKIIKEALHRGSEIKSGTKYLCNKWIHL
jgi:prolyl 4-hydroxylase